MNFASELAAERELVRHATEQLDAAQSATGLNLDQATRDLEQAALERAEARRRRRQPGSPWLHGRFELTDGATYYAGDFSLAGDEEMQVARNPSPRWKSFHEASTDDPQDVTRKRIYTYKEGTEELERFDDFDLIGDRLSADQQERAKASLGPVGLSLFSHHPDDGNWNDFTSAILADRIRVIDAPVNTTTAVVAGPGTARSDLFAHRVKSLRSGHPDLLVMVVVSEVDLAEASTALDQMDQRTRSGVELVGLDSFLSGHAPTDSEHIVVFDAAGHVETVSAALSQGRSTGSTVFCSDPTEVERLNDSAVSRNQGPAVVWIRYVHTTRRDIWRDSLRLAGIDPVSWQYPAAVIPGGHVLDHEWDQGTEDIHRFLDRTLPKRAFDGGTHAVCPPRLRGQVRKSGLFWLEYADHFLRPESSEDNPEANPAKEDHLTDNQDDHTVSALSEQPLGSSHELIVIDPDFLLRDSDVAARLVASMTQAQRKVHLIRTSTTDYS